MICWKQQGNWKDRKKKETRLILLYGKMQHRNISCDGKVPGVMVFRAGILNVLQWLQNIWEQQFDIHGGGMDLLFPHHESEIAQSTICNHTAPVRYWIHNNMITINGRKMGKSYNNVIKLTELFSGNHPLLEKAYHPMMIRFFILQTHYRSTLDFSNEALQAAEKGLKRLWEAYEKLQAMTYELREETLDSELENRTLKLIAEFDEFHE